MNNSRNEHNHSSYSPVSNGIAKSILGNRMTSTPNTTPPWKKRLPVSTFTSTRHKSPLSAPLYELSDTSIIQNPSPSTSQRPSKIQVASGPLLASTRFNVTLGTYVDSKSPGLSSRIVQYHNEKKEEKKTPTHQAKYGSPGLFPIVHLFKKNKPPLISPKPKRVTVRIATPDPSVYSIQEQNKILMHSIVKEPLNNSFDKADEGDTSTQSVLDALKEISRKRIHTGLECDNIDVRKKQKTDLINPLPDNSKRQREDSPPTVEANTAAQKPKRACVVDPIQASYSSSKFYEIMMKNYPEIESDIRIYSPKENTQKTEKTEKKTEKPLMNAQTQTSEVKPSKQDKDTFVDIHELPKSKSSSHSKSKEVTSTAPHERFVRFDEKPLEISKKNKLNALLAGITGEKPTFQPLKQPKLSDEEEPKETTEISQSNQPQSILSPPNKPKHDKHVSFNLPEQTNKITTSSPSSTRDCTITTASITSPISSIITAPNKDQVDTPKSSKNGEVTSNASAAASPTNGLNFNFGTNTSTQFQLPSPLTNQTTGSSNTQANSLPTTPQINFNFGSNTPQVTSGGFAFSESPVTPKINSDNITKSPQKVGGFKFDMPNSPTNLINKTQTSLTNESTGSAVNTSSPMFTFGSNKTTNLPTATNTPVTSNTFQFGNKDPTVTSNNSVNLSTANSPFTTNVMPTFNTVTPTTLGPSVNFGNSTPVNYQANNNMNQVSTNSIPTFGSTSSGFTFGNSTNTTASNNNTNTLTTSTFGTQNSNATTTTATSNLFGNATTNINVTSPNNTPTTKFSFGNTSSAKYGNTTSASSAFSSNTTTASSPFGNNTANMKFEPNKTASGFGSSGVNNTSTANVPNAFGANTPTFTFGPKTTSGPTFTNNTPGYPFGTTQQSSFGSNSVPTFGSNVSNFGSSVTQSSTFGSNLQPSVFGSAQTQSSSFGSAANQPSGFGSATTQPSGFGPTTTQQPSFGSNTTQQSGFGLTTTQPPGFGSTVTQSGFGTSKPSGFGAPTTQPLAFGSTTQASVFGSTTQTPSTQSSAFGSNSAQPMQSTIFGPNNNQTTGFGTTQSSTFGVNNKQPPAFGSNAAPTFGSGFSATTTSNSNFGTSNTPSFGSNFNATTTSSSIFGSNTSGFGASSSTNTFGSGAKSPFGTATTTAFGSTTPAFGSSTTSAFGPSTTSAFGSATTPSFGSSTTTAFGSNQPAFGSQNGPTFGSPNPPAFGSSANSAFGSSTNTPFGGGNASGFGSGGGTFGNASTPAFGSSSNAFKFGSNNNNNNSPGFGNQASAASAQVNNNNTFGTPSVNGFGNTPQQSNTFGSPQAQPGVFSFGGPSTGQSGGVFQFGTAEKPKTGGFNFTASNFSGAQTPQFNPPAQGMFSIGSGGSTSRPRSYIKTKRRP